MFSYKQTCSLDFNIIEIGFILAFYLW